MMPHRVPPGLFHSNPEISLFVLLIVCGFRIEHIGRAITRIARRKQMPFSCQINFEIPVADKLSRRYGKVDRLQKRYYALAEFPLEVDPLAEQRQFDSGIVFTVDKDDATGRISPQDLGQIIAAPINASIDYQVEIPGIELRSDVSTVDLDI